MHKPHLIYLDSVRGLAALAVFNEHFIIAYGLPCPQSWCQQLLETSPLNIWWDGGVAVSMFFVLSGLVLSLKYFRHGQQPDLKHFNLHQYIVGRLFRIWPPYLVILIISAMLYRYHITRPLIETALPASAWVNDMWHQHQLNFMDMARESFLLHLPELLVLLPQAWTLSTELVLSLLLPVGLLLAEKGQRWLVFFALITVTVLGVSIFLLHFLIGMSIARYYSVIAFFFTRNPKPRRLALLSGVLIYTLMSIFQERLNVDLIWLSSGVGVGLILLFLSGSVRSQNLLANSLFRYLGKVSYSAYLIHMTILICLTPPILKGLGYLSHDRAVLWLSAWFLSVTVVQLFAILSYRYLEIPSIAIGKRLMSSIYRVKN